MTGISSSARRFGVFNLVAFGGFSLQMIVLSVLTRAFGWHYAIATAVGIEVALLHNFAGHNRWTWSDRPVVGGRALLHRLGRYQAVKSLTIGANLAMTAWLVHQLRLPLEIANVVAVVALSAVNYLLSDRLIFGEASAPSRILPYLRLIKFRYHVTFLNVIFGALIFAPVIDWTLAWRLAVLYISFNVLLYGGIYTLNDVADRGADRLHPFKRDRPVAAGLIRPSRAVAFAALLITAGLLSGVWLGLPVLACYLTILVINAAYSGGGRNIVGVDVVLNALPHVVRVGMGALLVHREPPLSHLIAFFAVAVTMACVRREVELDVDRGQSRKTSLQYTRSHLSVVMLVCLGVFLVVLRQYAAAAPGFYATLASSSVVLLGAVYFSASGRHLLRRMWTH